MGARPFGRFRHAVLVAEHVVLEPIEAVGMRFDVLPIVRVLGHPHIRDRQLQRGIGIRKYGEPFIGMNDSRVIAVGSDGEVLDTAILEPKRHPGSHLAAPAPRGGLRIATPVQKRIAILGDILSRMSWNGCSVRRDPCPTHASRPNTNPPSYRDCGSGW